MEWQRVHVVVLMDMDVLSADTDRDSAETKEADVVGGQTKRRCFGILTS